MKPLVHINYPLDKDLILGYVQEQEANFKAYTDTRYNITLDFWKSINCDNEYINRVIQDLNIDCKPRIYKQLPYSYLEPHTDNITECAINFVIKGDDSPICIQGVEYHYKQAIVNTRELHSVRTGTTERILLKLSIYNEKYVDLVERLKGWIDDV